MYYLSIFFKISELKKKITFPLRPTDIIDKVL